MGGPRRRCRLTRTARSRLASRRMLPCCRSAKLQPSTVFQPLLFARLCVPCVLCVHGSWDDRNATIVSVIDSHCHLADDTFVKDLNDVVARARDAGVSRVMVILEGGNAAEAEQARRIADIWPGTRFAIGVHPHQAHEFSDDPDRAAAVVRAQFASTPGARAVGEIGLDYHYDFSPRDVQQAVFRAQIGLARELERPVVIHTREADEDTIGILRDEGGGEVRGVLHCFTGNDALADAGLALGFFVSLAGIITFPKAAPLRQTARRVPLDRL